MKIYAAADIHGRMERLNAVIEAVRRHQPEVTILAGDVLHYRRPPSFLKALATLPGPVMVIRGNTDPAGFGPALERFPHFHLIHLRAVACGGLRFAGLGGTLPIPFNSRIGWSEDRLVRALAPLIDTRTILVVHPPPRGVRDHVLGRFSAGSRGLRRLVRRCPPAVVICGHIHEDAGISGLDRTLVVNCALGRTGRGALIDYDGHGPPEVRML